MTQTTPTIEGVAGARARAVLSRLRVRKARAEAVSFCNTYCWAQDFEKKPVPEPFKVTLWPWQEDYVGRLQHHGLEQLRLILLKGRGPGATWASILFGTWAMWARPPSQVLLVSDTAPKAKALLRRHRFCAGRLDPELEYPVPDPVTGTDNLTSRIFPNGSEIHSLTGDPESIRSYHPTLIILDEAAKLKRDPRPPLIGIASDIVMMSTAAGIGNPFEETWTDAYKDGGAEWGYEPLFVSWREIPGMKERPKGSPQVVSQEHPETPEEAFQASGANLHRLGDDQLVDPFDVPKAWPVVAGADPGVRTGGWLYVVRVCGAQGPMADGDLLIVDEFDSAETTIDKQVEEYRKRRGRLRLVHSVIDPSAYSRTHTGEGYVRDADLFADRGVHFVPGSNDKRAAIHALQLLLEGRRLWVMRHLVGIIHDIRTVTLANIDQKHLYAALRYIALEDPASYKPLPKARTRDYAAEQLADIARATDREEEEGPPRIRGTGT